MTNFHWLKLGIEVINSIHSLLSKLGTLNPGVVPMWKNQMLNGHEDGNTQNSCYAALTVVTPGSTFNLIQSVFVSTSRSLVGALKRERRQCRGIRWTCPSVHLRHISLFENRGDIYCCWCGDQISDPHKTELFTDLVQFQSQVEHVHGWIFF